MRTAAHTGAGKGPRDSESVAILLELLSAHRHGLVHDNLKVAQLARESARRLGLAAEDVAQIELAARLHDIGKIAIPDAILQKPGALTNEEWTVMRTQTEIGARIIGAAATLAPVARLVLYHHERYDGTGYPDGLAGEKIPIGARIIAVCDAFVAMMRERPYINAITVAEAIAELQRGSGSQFDPHAVEAFEVVFNELFG
jgi:two-component system cell cycle response regulator